MDASCWFRLTGISDVANALSIPPGEYGRKAKTQRNRRGLAQAVEHVVQFDNNRKTLPGLDTLTITSRKQGVFTRRLEQVLHGCRQLVP